MNKKFTAIDIANYIVDYTNNTLKKQNLTPIKLQKILYYVYVNCLVKHNAKIFDQPIEKWKFGPVVSDVYHNFKMHGTSHINATVPEYKFTDNPDGGFSFDLIPFDKTDIEYSSIANEIKSTISSLIDQGPFDLVEKTHQEEPWKRCETMILSGAKGLLYSDQELKEYFKNKI